MGSGTPYGTWASPISTSIVAGAVTRRAWPALDGGRTWWLEQRPHQRGRGVVCSVGDGGDTVEHTAPDHDVRSLVHEYGGLPFVVRDGTVWYCNHEDQRVWRLPPDGSAAPVTPAPPDARSVRYADLHLAPDGTWIAAVRERHEADGVHNDVVAIPADGTVAPTVLVEGSDFFAAPCVSPDGTRLAWLSWDHPDMPWDATLLSTGRMVGTGLADRAAVAGGGTTSIFQPAWNPDGVLYFVGDGDGWWNLYRLIGGRPEQLTHERAELGLPLWRLGTSTYAFLDDRHAVCLVNRDAGLRMHLLDTGTGDLARTPLTSLLCDASPAAHDGEVAVIAATDRALPQVLHWRPADDAVGVVAGSAGPDVDDAYLAVGRDLAVPGADGQVVHAVYWPPTHPAAASDGPPPLLVDVHGGPTAQVGRTLRMDFQFWTSRGFGLVAVNYGGSTGYGRAYRDRLRGAWGVVDVDDCVSVARWLVAEGHADADRLAIRGGSAGGFTTLAALTQVGDFSAGVSLFGVSDLRLLAAETHKFESRYLDGLVGDDPDAWSERAPIEHVARITAPLLLLQGEEDEIVPPSQAERMVAQLDAAGSPHAYVTFPGEQHGFRRAASIRRALEVELSFYGQVWGFVPSDDVEVVEVRHLG